MWAIDGGIHSIGTWQRSRVSRITAVDSWRRRRPCVDGRIHGIDTLLGAGINRVYAIDPREGPLDMRVASVDSGWRSVNRSIHSINTGHRADVD